MPPSTQQQQQQPPQQQPAPTYEMVASPSPGSLGVQGIPYLALYKGGEKVAEMTGARPKSQLKEWLEGQL